MKRTIRVKAAAIALAVAGAFGAVDEVAAQSANEIFVPVLVYRTGAYAPNGIPWADGYVDYLKLVNAKGGVNGIKIAYEECETGYATDRGVECYERLKSKKPVAVNPLSTGITYALTEKAPNDKIVLFTTGYGRADSIDGSVFASYFPSLGSDCTETDMVVQHVTAKAKSLKGKKIALVYHDSPYGKEPIKLLEERAKREGFQLTLVPITQPGVEQKATW